jgi:hypothetical protein
MHAVMKHWHPMIGRDMHIPWPPGSPTPAPSPVPYVTASTMLGIAVTASYAASHQSQGLGMTMQMGTDIGPMIPHMGAPSNLLAIEIPLSSSKSYFGPSNDLAEGKPIAAALLVNVNPNLNCGTPVPLPLGTVIALNTHYVGMSFADICGGLGAMASDWVVQSALQYFGGRLGSKLAGKLFASRLGQYITGKVGAKIHQRALFRALMSDEKWASVAALDAARAWERAAPAIFDETVGQVVGFFTGGPMGADADTIGGPGSTLAGEAGQRSQDRARGAGEAVGGALDNYLGDPSVEDHPMGDYPAPSSDAPVA